MKLIGQVLLDSCVAVVYMYQFHIFPNFQRRRHNISILAVYLADDPSRPLGHGAMQYGDLDFEMLINRRRQHQTKQQAATGVRTKKFKADSSHETTIRKKIIKYMNFTKG